MKTKENELCSEIWLWPKLTWHIILGFDPTRMHQHRSNTDSRSHVFAGVTICAFPEVRKCNFYRRERKSVFAIRWLSVPIHRSRFLAVEIRLRGDCHTARRLTHATQGRGVTRRTADFRLVPEDSVTGDHFRSPAGSWFVSWASALVAVNGTKHLHNG